MSLPNKNSPSMAIDLTEFRIGWKILILALVGMLTSLSTVPLYSFGSLILPLQAEFGWSREEIMPAIGILFGANIVAIQIGGWLIRRYGLRIVTLSSLVSLAIAYLLTTLITGHIWQLYTAYAFLAFAGMGTTVVTWTQLTNLWFEKNRGLALALTLCGSGLAALILPSIISRTIDLLDWRAAYWALAAMPLLITWPLSMAWLSTRKPTSTSDRDRTISAPQLSGLSLKATSRSPRFWLLNISLLLSATSMLGMVTSTIPMLQDKGLTANEAAMAFGVYGAALLIGRMVVGYLIDRFWAPGVAFIVLSAPAVGCIIFYLADPHMAILMIASILVGVGAGAEMDIAAFITARYFGMRDYSRIFGLEMGVLGVGSTLAPLYFAFLYSQTSSYSGLLVHCIVTFALSSAMLLIMGRYPKFGHDEPMRSSLLTPQPGH